MKAQLTAMEDWIKSHEQQLTGREEDVREFREELRRGWATANQLQTELDDLANVLATEKARIGLDNQVLTTEEDVRKRYTEALNKERELAEQIHSRLGPEGTVQVNRIGELRLRTDKLGREVKEIKAELAKRVNQEAEKLRGQAAQEEKNLQLFETGLNTLEQESSNLAGEVAYKALEDVRQKFYKLVLDADVGVLDVAWGRMQETGRRITDLTKKKNAESKQLKKEYKSVLEEVQ
jgi:DNA anti-recombination protein RmuC